MDFSNLKGILPIEVIRQLEAAMTNPVTTQEVQQVATAAIQQQTPQIAHDEATSVVQETVPDMAEGIAEEVAQEELVQQAMKQSDAVKLVPIGPIGTNKVELVSLRKKTWVHLVLPYNVHKKFADKLSFDAATDLDKGELEPSTWYHYFAVDTGPLETDIALKASKTSPNIGGPYGYTSYYYMGANYCNEKGQLELFTQTGSRFKFLNAKYVENKADAALFCECTPQPVYLNSVVPTTANEVTLLALVTAKIKGSGKVDFYPVGGEDDVNNPYASVESFIPSVTPLFFELPTPGEPKMLYRRVTEYTGDLDDYTLILQGYKDEYLL